MTKKPKQLIVIGDSGVYGWGDRDGGGWCERLRISWMSQPEAPIIYQLGIRGDGLERVAKRWDSEWRCRGELRRKVPDGLLIAVGINDTAKIGRSDGRPQLSAEAYRFGLQQLLREIKEHSQVMMIGLTAVDEEVMPYSDCLWYSNQAIAIYEAQIEEACLEVKVPFLPLHSSMICDPNYLHWIEPDGIHLNSEGHEWVHQKIKNWSSLLNWAELKPIRDATPLFS